ncbi:MULTISPECIES: hypothetical protein [Brevundimonas]|jgi:hypothetical protein|uniref:Uncharacterized protein n=1 Tax=Brevundimonas nasdae TaxID=172043 RepID=A0ABX8TGE4_9CAUL|nr:MULTISPECIES: hypothetical protein [Brevundimonas]MBU1384764.1 hypothetical protein [Alphaproteobacteria bacterium]MBU2271819.1 hypothetical protein [Alphaproteobacteria bacterium]MBU2419582.1 hypothetical protein [Alphaproteobacteria bacterium]MRL68940.1 hypothetical protein [Brevundimonas sp. SPF441]QYC09693.1 hypothetical protein KWG56_14045 [Brevundimonas nasdae]
MTRMTSPLFPMTFAAMAIGLIASLLIAFTPVIHSGLPLAIVAGGLMLALMTAGIAIDRRRAMPAAVLVRTRS